MRTLEETFGLLSEELSQTVYHATNIESVYNMLTGKGFKLSRLEKSGLKKHPVNTQKYRFYMSTARSMNSDYIRDFIYDGESVVIEFDGKKLSQNFKGKAVDWFADQEDSSIRYDETEDRLYSKVDTIPEIGKYIRAIHVHSSVKQGRQADKFQMFMKLNRNFPVYIYKLKKDMLFARRERADKV